ncbi:MAG TPA: DUF4097 family beta strand repeat-containing protein [Candidatus Baltobacteraceae bacterium]|jgi:hypothetical protein
MNRTMALISLAAAFALQGCGVSMTGNISHDRAVQSHVHQVVPLARNGAVEVHNVSGDVRISTWNRPSVGVDAVIYGATAQDVGNTEVDVHRDGDTVVIRTQYPHGGGFGQSSGASVDYRVRLPSTAAVNVANVDGTIAVAGVANTVNAANVSGDVTVTGSGGDLKLATTSGDIDARAASVLGNGRIDIASVSGTLHLHVPRSTSASVSAASISGDFTSDFPLQSNKGTIGVKAAGTLGSGGATIKLASVSGSIELQATK